MSEASGFDWFTPPPRPEANLSGDLAGYCNAAAATFIDQARSVGLLTEHPSHAEAYTTVNPTNGGSVTGVIRTNVTGGYRIFSREVDSDSMTSIAVGPDLLRRSRALTVSGMVVSESVPTDSYVLREANPEDADFLGILASETVRRLLGGVIIPHDVAADIVADRPMKVIRGPEASDLLGVAVPAITHLLNTAPATDRDGVIRRVALPAPHVRDLDADPVGSLLEIDQSTSDFWYAANILPLKGLTAYRTSEHVGADIAFTDCYAITGDSDDDREFYVRLNRNMQTGGTIAEFFLIDPLHPELRDSVRVGVRPELRQQVIREAIAAQVQMDNLLTPNDKIQD